MIELTCISCKKPFSHIRFKKFCHRSCQTGEFNSNSGKKWSSEKKAAQSEIIKSKVDADYRTKCASANSGVKFSAERIAKMHGHRNSDSYSRPHSDATKLIISEKSIKKFTPAYWKKLKAKMYLEGQWINPADKGDYEIYYKLTDWVCPMWNLFESVPGGVFNSRKNPKGMVRDHILSRRDGLELGIWPELMRHPANCQLLSHSENVSKGGKSWYTYAELYDKIKMYSSDWFEQELCLNRISQFNNGIFWSRKEVSNELANNVGDF